MVALSAEVTAGVFFRTIGLSLSWYDEVASVMLAWLTFYGSALAALKRAHIGFPGLVNGMPPAWRLAFVLFTEVLVIGFFALLGWTGYSVLEVLATDNLVSLPWITVAWTQSVITGQRGADHHRRTDQSRRADGRRSGARARRLRRLHRSCRNDALRRSWPYSCCSPASSPWC